MKDKDKLKFKPKSELKFKADARNQLFWKIKGLGLTRFIETAVRYNALTLEEREKFEKILELVNSLINNQFNNTKIVGLNAKRRCTYCKNVAHFKIENNYGTKYLCNEHKKLLEHDIDQFTGRPVKYNIITINPNE